MPKKNNIVLFIGPYILDAINAVKDLEKYHKKKYRIAFLYDKKAESKHPELKSMIDFDLPVEVKNMAKVEQALAPIRDQIVVVSCRSVFYMPLYARMIALFPNLHMPTRDSIEWCQNKLEMRRKFRRHCPEITPKFAAVKGTKPEDIDRVKRLVGFPCIVKPASLAASRLISVCYHEEELESTLRKVFRGIRSAYKNNGAMVQPEVIVEQFLEGDTYAIDGYVNATGEKITLLPATHYKTGFHIGIDDFFTYRHITPTRLTEEEESLAQEVIRKGVRALGLRSCMLHCEVVRVEDGWQMLEVDARMGGHRDFMYREAFGVPHGMNDLLVRMNEKPLIRRKHKRYVAAFNIFPKRKGLIKSITGLKKVRELESLHELIVAKKVGDMAGLSKQGFNKVLDVMMANSSREALLADIRRMEKAIEIKN